MPLRCLLPVRVVPTGGLALLPAVLLACTPAAAEVPKAAETIRTAAGNIAVTEVAGGLVHPWGMALLPDGGLLVTERPGRLRRIAPDGTLAPEPLAGVPQVFAEGQGGLLDVALDPEFAQNRLVWLSFAEPGDGGTAGTALGRGRLGDAGLEGFETVWRQEKVEGPNHFGSRIVFAGDGTLFLTLGERFKFDPAQDLSNALGTVVRLTREGEPAPGNPFLDREDAAPEIFSYGHRNIQAAAIEPGTGTLWVAEMGPLGGDELNLVEKGANYGWPEVSWGTDYDGAEIPDPTTRTEFEDARLVWTPVIAPSGMVFYEGAAFPAFEGDALIGGLVSEGITRLDVEEGEIRGQEHIPLGRRIRDVEVDGEGRILVLTDRPDGALWRLAPL